MKRIYLKFAAMIALGATICSCNTYEQYTDKLYFTGTDFSVTPRVMVDPDELPAQYPMNVVYSSYAPVDLTVNLEIAPELIPAYNAANGTEYAQFPADGCQLACYVEKAGPDGDVDMEKITAPTSLPITIEKGKAQSNTGYLEIVSTEGTDLTTTYLIPVRISNYGELGLLESASVMYFIVKRVQEVSALKMYNSALETPPTRQEENYIFEAKTFANDPSMKLTNLTLEARIRIHRFRGEGSDVGGATSISIMGVETEGMLRVGKANEPQVLQIGKPGYAFDTEKKLQKNTWHHVAFTYDGSVMRLYIDGKVEATKEATKDGEPVVFNYDLVNTPTTGGRGFTIGLAGNNFRPAWCDIHEIRVWNVARTTTQIESGMFGVDPESEGLVAYWKLDEGEGNVAHDCTGNGHDMTLLRYTIGDGPGVPPTNDHEVLNPQWLHGIKFQ